MAEHDRIVLRLNSDDDQRIALARRYWDGSELSGKWVWAHPVQSIADEIGCSKGEVARILRSVATAFDSSRQCPECGTPECLESRSSLVVGVRETSLPCKECQLKCQSKILEDAAQKRSLDLSAKQAIIVDNSVVRPCEYNWLGFPGLDTAILLYSLLLASNEACNEGTFFAADLHWCPDNALASKLLNRLHGEQFLRFHPDTKPDVILLNETGKWQYYPLQVRWALQPDADGRSFAAVFTNLGGLIDEAVSDLLHECQDLYKTVTLAELLRFLHAELDTYQLQFEEGPKTIEALNYVRQRFPIPAARRLIRTSVKNAAALTRSREFQRKHALNTIPGNLIRSADRAINEQWQLYPIVNAWNDEPTLLTVLFDRVLRTSVKEGFSVMSGDAFDRLCNESWTRYTAPGEDATSKPAK